MFDLPSWDSIKQKYLEFQNKLSDVASWDSIMASMRDSVSFSLSLPIWVRKVQSIINTDDKHSLGFEIIQDSQDMTLNPEIAMPAYVRLGPQLSVQETKFRQRRSKFTKRSLSKFLGIPASSIDERDVPTIAVTGSGGGYRAMIASSGYFNAMQTSGLFDCLTYVAGVSGSTWALALFYTLAEYNTVTLLDHVKDRTGIHIAYVPALIDLITKMPTDKYLLHGIIEKTYYNFTGVSLADIYGVLLSSRLMVPKNELIVDRDSLKISSQRRIVDTGAVPMPIYTAVRHEIGLTEGEQAAVDESETIERKAEIQESNKRESWFQWFEFTPYEVGCEELAAWIPTWSLGRKWASGASVETPVPELNLTLLLGTFGSAFCATLSHFYKEIRPALNDMPIETLDTIMMERDQDLKEVHPITPAGIPNYVLGLKQYLPSTCPPSLYTAKEINLMDAGMDNNLAVYPLLRPEREVDMIIAFDCSADIQDVPWLELTAGYTKKRGILGWPMEAGWPKGQDHAHDMEQLEKGGDMVGNTKEALAKVEQQKTDHKPEKGQGPAERARKTLGPVSIWTGTIEDKDTGSADDRPDTDDFANQEFKLRSPNAGITFVYCPLIPNEKVPGVDPDTSPYMSTWNFIYTNEEIDKVAQLARTNLAEGEDRIKRAVQLIYERKRAKRIEKEEAAMRLWRQNVLHSDKN
ncbi:acyl transferase/acyl hydrolase/lysophospholipase [Lipomyces arxii]|uniref:acyl transferase/acyl hydrolase/lysophospholipase n=1 Tax=Lipomyces arxii TaxID=56418 RepID=UPI0034CD6D7F